MMKMQYTLIPFSKYVYALVSRQKNKKIDFFIIGAQKCGTTSLHDYMNQHPFCTGALRKETLFFTKKYSLKNRSNISFFIMNCPKLFMS